MGISGAGGNAKRGRPSTEGLAAGTPTPKTRARAIPRAKPIDPASDYLSNDLPRLNIRVSPQMRDAMRWIAHEAGVSINAMAEQLLRSMADIYIETWRARQCAPGGSGAGASALASPDALDERPSPLLASMRQALATAALPAPKGAAPDKSATAKAARARAATSACATGAASRAAGSTRGAAK